MSKLIVLVGPPGSGKSTAAARLIEDLDAVRINQDEQGKEGHLKLFMQALDDKRNIVVDRMNFSKKQRLVYTTPAIAHDYNIEMQVFHAPYDVCMERCKNRVGHPTITDTETAKKAISFFFRNYERVEDSEANNVERLGWEDASLKAVVVDIDGTMANVNHRLHYVRGSNKNWKEFFGRMRFDDVNEWCRKIVNSLAGQHPIVFATGRPSDYKEETIEWLKKYELFSYPITHLFMRHKGDHRKDDIAKEIILEFEILPRYGILVVIDDRQQVVDMWRRHGHVVLQCDKGDF